MERHFIAPLSFFNDSLLGITIAPGVEVEKWCVKKATTLISKCSPFENKDAIFRMLSENFCLDEEEKHAYVVAGSLEMGDKLQTAENTIKLMRLFKEGSIDIARWYIYKEENGRLEPMSSMEGNPIDPQYHYHLSEDEKTELDIFLKRYALPFSLPYIQLAFENFDESYKNYNINLSFLSLMIAVEILFNDGVSELKYRLTRGMAVLLGADKSECRQIYIQLKKLYDKRSHLVHTGKASISLEDVISLRHRLRLSIKKLLNLGLSKADLSFRLLEHGFGQDIGIGT